MLTLSTGLAGAVAAVCLAQPEVPAPKVLWKVPIKSASFGGAATAEIDGKPVVAFTTYFGDARVMVLNGKDGNEVWTFHDGDHCYDASVRFYDLDGDKKLELVTACSDASTVLAFDAAKGEVKWKRELGLGECIDTPPFIGDVEGDAKPEIVVGTFKGKLWVLGADGRVKRELKVAPGAVQSCPVVMDLNPDGTRDFMAANFNGDHALHAVDGATGKELWRIQTGAHIYHGPSIVHAGGELGDLAVIGSYDGHVYAASLKTGELKWKRKTGDRYIMAPTTALDVDGDGKDEVVSTSQKITVLNGDGTIRWQEDANKSEYTGGVTRGVAVADLDADGAPDLVYLDDTGGFRARRARDGKVIYALDANAFMQEDTEGDHAPVIADLDGDGRVDVFFVVGVGAEGKRRGMAVALTGFAGKASARNEWRMFRHDTTNTGNIATPVQAGASAR